MPVDRARIIYGLGPDGYGILSETGTAKHESRSALIAFCKSIAWRPAKIDYPEQRCVALVPTGDGVWLCLIEEGGRDRYDRGLSLNVAAELFGHDDPALREAIASAGGDYRKADGRRGDQPVLLTHPGLLSGSTHHVGGTKVDGQTDAATDLDSLGAAPRGGATAQMGPTNLNPIMSRSGFMSKRASSAFIVAAILVAVGTYALTIKYKVDPLKGQLSDRDRHLASWEDALKPYGDEPGGVVDRIQSLLGEAEKAKKDIRGERDAAREELAQANEQLRASDDERAQKLRITLQSERQQFSEFLSRLLDAPPRELVQAIEAERARLARPTQEGAPLGH